MNHWHADCDMRPPASALYLIDAPSSPVVSRTEMKAHLRVDYDDDNLLIDSLTAAVTQHLDGKDGILGRALQEQSWELRMSFFPRSIRLPLPPLISVDAVQYLDLSAARVTIDKSRYVVTGEQGRGVISLGSGAAWPAQLCNHPEAAIVSFTCGYEKVPDPIKAAIKLMVATLYQNREHVVVGQTAIELPWAAEALLRPYIVIGA